MNRGKACVYRKLGSRESGGEVGIQKWPPSRGWKPSGARTVARSRGEGMGEGKGLKCAAAPSVIKLFVIT